jgi:hypothetical protein
MIYARVHDQTVADDYYAAMQQIEKSLSLPSTQKDTSAPIGENERTQLLELTTQLEQPELNLNALGNRCSNARGAGLSEERSNGLFVPRFNPNGGRLCLIPSYSIIKVLLSRNGIV